MNTSMPWSVSRASKTVAAGLGTTGALSSLGVDGVLMTVSLYARSQTTMIPHSQGEEQFSCDPGAG